MKRIMCVLVLALLMVTSVQANLLVNGDFETGSVTGYWQPATYDSPPWSRFAWGGDVSNAWLTDGGGNNDGGVQGVVTASDMAMKWRWSNNGIAQTVDVAAGTDYTLSLDVFNSATDATANDWGIYIKVNFMRADNSWIDLGGTNTVEIAGYDAAVETPGSWVTVSGAYIAPAEAVAMTYRIIAQGNGGGGYLYADNASVVPEPATLALLSIGSLTLLRRKR